ncbi:MAG: acyltransferase [Bacteroidales bacterium]|nr:acyltransferase [Bacteroidales bacterium]
MKPDYNNKIFNIKCPEEFEAIALDLFHYQASDNLIYKEFINRIGVNPAEVKRIENIPFLPIEFFRNHIILTGFTEAKMFFESSGTTAMKKSRHYIADLSLYDESLLRGFRLFYGEPENYLIAGLLPSFTERPHSSLSYMINKLIECGADKKSGFFSDDYKYLKSVLKSSIKKGKKVMLIGVSYTLIDLAEKKPVDLAGLIIVETGGMKGLRKEITREELHTILKNSFGVSEVHSEYGMTELLSQAWSHDRGLFRCPPWMKVLVREINDPLSVTSEPGKSGAINVIDLANINSCAFIATGDIGKLHEGSFFEVTGRYDHSEARGCNMMIE